MITDASRSSRRRRFHYLAQAVVERRSPDRASLDRQIGELGISRALFGLAVGLLELERENINDEDSTSCRELRRDRDRAIRELLDDEDALPDDADREHVCYMLGDCWGVCAGVQVDDPPRRAAGTSPASASAPTT